MGGKSIKNKRYQVNNRIRAKELRVITADGENLGVINTSQALDEAHKRNLDLVVIAEGANPPVAKILDFKKFLYDESKKASAAKAGSKKSELKELRFGPTIGKGDVDNRIKRAKEFIEENNQVRVTVQMRGRQNAYPEVAFEKIQMITEGLEDVARLESEPKHKGNMVVATYIPK